MPSNAVLEKKKQLVEELSEKMKGSVAGVLVDYKGINVEDDTKLRKELREAGVDYFVVKNTILLRAAKNIGFDALESVLSGTTALALSKEDAVTAAKILAKRAEKTKDQFIIKAGFVEGNILDASGVNQLAKLPGKEELIGMTLRGLNAPITGFVNVLNGNIRGLCVALNAIAEKQQPA
ncbi:MAG: 50S ribosomal protein L10 [Oscillospiraceae bacterium]|nr:50S ribosomal protein L10 [Oscillospiraceae bacterium]